MEIKDFKIAKKVMEDEMLKCLTTIIDRFTLKTGYCPTTVNVYMDELTKIGEQQKTAIITSVNTEFDW